MRYSYKMSGWMKFLIAMLIIAVLVLTGVVLYNKVPAVATFFDKCWTWICDLFTGKLFKK